MKVDWKVISHIAAGVVGVFVPNAVAIEQTIENAVTAPTGQEKANSVIAAALTTLNSYAQLGGKDYATPRVQRAIHRLNDDSVELLDALAEAHKAG